MRDVHPQLKQGRTGCWRSIFSCRVLLAGVLSAMIVLAACGGDEEKNGSDDVSQTPESTLVAATDGVEAVVVVERVMVFPRPDRNAEPITYLFERERVIIRGQNRDGTFYLVTLNGEDGWILGAQVDVTGDIGQIAVVEAPIDTPVPTPEMPTVTPTQAVPTHTPLPTRTPLPTQTPAHTPSDGTLDAVDIPASPVQDSTPSGQDPTHDPNLTPTLPPVQAGVPPPLTITLPEGWQTLHLLVPFRTFNADRDLPLSIYTGPLPGGVTGYIYLFWGFPNVVSPTKEFNLWADGLQLLRGSLVGETCNLGIDQEQQAFWVGGQEGIGTFYTAVACEGETDTAGWFAAMRVYNGNFAFFTAVEPLDTLPDQTLNLQAILDTVEFSPPGDD